MKLFFLLFNVEKLKFLVDIGPAICQQDQIKIIKENSKNEQ